MVLKSELSEIDWTWYNLEAYHEYTGALVRDWMVAFNIHDIISYAHWVKIIPKNSEISNSRRKR